jgi:hypothetical protein
MMDEQNLLQAYGMISREQMGSIEWESPAPEPKNGKLKCLVRSCPTELLVGCGRKVCRFHMRKIGMLEGEE